MMRVGLFTESYDPVVNGVSTSVKTLAMELAQAGHEPVVVAPRFPGFEDAPPTKDGITVLRMPSWRTPFNPLNPFAYPPIGPVPAVLRGVRFDVIHTQQPFGMGRHGRACSRRLGIPLVSTFHTLYMEYAHYFPLAPRAAVRGWLADQLRRYYETCDAVVVPSRAAGDLLRAIGISPRLRLERVPTGVPAAPMVVPAAIEQARRSLSLPSRAPVLLFVGRLAREKNLDLLLEAFERLCAAGDAHGVPPEERPILLLAGSGPYRAACQERVTHGGIAPWVRFAGFLRRTDLAPVYALSTLFVFPSTTETQGVVLSEAQSHGLPCVVVRGGGAPEFVRDGVDAVVVPPDVDALGAAVWDLLVNDSRRHAFSEAALTSPLRPTPAGMALRLLELYGALQSDRAAATAVAAVPADAAAARVRSSRHGQ